MIFGDQVGAGNERIVWSACDDDHTDDESGQTPSLACYSHIRDSSKDFEVAGRDPKMSASDCNTGDVEGNRTHDDKGEEIALCVLSHEDGVEGAEADTSWHPKEAAASSTPEPSDAKAAGLDVSLLWPGAGATSEEIRRRLERMASANARLQADNARLRLQAEREPTQHQSTSGCASGGGSIAPPSQQGVTRPHRVSLDQALSRQQRPFAPQAQATQQQCMSAWWVPAGMAMPTQIMCVAAPSQPRSPAQGSAESETPKVRRGRRARAREAREVVRVAMEARTAHVAGPFPAESSPWSPAVASIPLQESMARAGLAFPAPNSAPAVPAVPFTTRSSAAVPVSQRSVGGLPSRAILPAPVKSMPEPSSDEPRTTVMLRNMPNNYSRTMVLELLDGAGFAGRYDFIYLPIDFRSRASLGYAFVNLVSHEAALAFWAAFDGFSRWAIPSRKVSGVSWSGALHGLEAHVERYQNSPVMSDEVPDEYKPAIFADGVRQSFPAPTRKLRPPRLH